MINIRTRNIPIIKGIAARAPFARGIPAISHDMKRQAPTGGVTNPIARAITVTTPKRRGSIPRIWITGNNTGTNRIMLAPRSINIPVTK